MTEEGLRLAEEGQSFTKEIKKITYSLNKSSYTQETIKNVKVAGWIWQSEVVSEAPRISGGQSSFSPV